MNEWDSVDLAILSLSTIMNRMKYHSVGLKDPLQTYPLFLFVSAFLSFIGWFKVALAYFQVQAVVLLEANIQAGRGQERGKE